MEALTKKETPKALSDEEFQRKSKEWKPVIEGGKKSVNDLISFIETKDQLTVDQKMTIASWAKPA